MIEGSRPLASSCLSTYHLIPVVWRSKSNSPSYMTWDWPKWEETRNPFQQAIVACIYKTTEGNEERKQHIIQLLAMPCVYNCRISLKLTVSSREAPNYRRNAYNNTSKAPPTISSRQGSGKNLKTMPRLRLTLMVPRVFRAIAEEGELHGRLTTAVTSHGIAMARWTTQFGLSIGLNSKRYTMLSNLPLDPPVSSPSA